MIKENCGSFREFVLEGRRKGRRVAERTVAHWNEQEKDLDGEGDGIHAEAVLGCGEVVDAEASAGVGTGNRLAALVIALFLECLPRESGAYNRSG